MLHLNGLHQILYFSQNVKFIKPIILSFDYY